ERRRTMVYVRPDADLSVGPDGDLEGLCCALALDRQGDARALVRPNRALQLVPVRLAFAVERDDPIAVANAGLRGRTALPHRDAHARIVDGRRAAATDRDDEEKGAREVERDDRRARAGERKRRSAGLGGGRQRRTQPANAERAARRKASCANADDDGDEREELPEKTTQDFVTRPRR